MAGRAAGRAALSVMTTIVIPDDRAVLPITCQVVSQNRRPAVTGFRALAGSPHGTLSRLCRAELGMTFPQWRTQLRLHQALRLLADGRSVTGVACATGWATTSAFVDVFHRHLGYTPGRRSASSGGGETGADARTVDARTVDTASGQAGSHQ